MRKILILLCFFLQFANLIFAQNKMVVKGVIKDYPFDKLYVRADVPKSQSFFDDTIRVVNGRFEYTKEVSSPIHYTFVASNMLSKFTAYLGIENVDVKVQYCVDDFKFVDLRVSGSTVYRDFEEVETQYEQEISAMNRFQNSVYKENNSLKKKEIEVQVSKSKRALIAKMLSDKKMRDNLAVPYFVYNQIDFSEYDFAKESLSKLSSKQKNVLYSQRMLITLDQAKCVVIGAEAYDFDLEDLDGKRYKLSNFRGKYILLEFSASWCGWCKKEIPYITQAYEYGKDKGLVVITINLDNKRELWMKEVDVPWLTLSDLKAFDSEVTRKYNVSGIPQLYLIDEKGKIECRDLRGDDLVNYIKKIIK